MNLTPETWRRVAEVVADWLRPDWTAAEAVAVERFLADAAGKVRAMLDVDKDGPGLSLLDAAGKAIWRAP